MRNLVAAPVFATPVPVPDDGDWVTADAAGAADGPNNPAEQGLLNKIWAIVKGTVTLESLTIDGGNPGAPQVSTPGLIATTGNILALGLIQAGDVISSGVEFFISTAAARVGVTPKGVSWTAITALDPAGPNPPGTTALRNEVRALNTCKAWIRFTGDGAHPNAAIAVKDRANVASVSFTTSRKARIIFAEPMADDKYSVTCSATDGAAPQNPAAITWTVNYVDIIFPQDVDGGAGVAIDCSVHVFGRQN